VIIAVGSYNLLHGNTAKAEESGTTTEVNYSGLEIPVTQSRTGGEILQRTGYTLSYNADYKTPQWVAWELTKEEVTQGTEEAQQCVHAGSRCEGGQGRIPRTIPARATTAATWRPPAT